ncbi:MAG: septum formation inhibitor Maf [Clostridiales bacterium]|nr:septum formation inhibitor Maf [Clostridiales bacterium]
MKKIFLASGSPRRRELLRNIGLKFEVVKSNFDENTVDFERTPQELAESLAYGKAKNVKSLVDQGIIIGADTLVTLDNKVYGKPRDSKEAFDMLKSLSDKTHEVITGVVLIDTVTNEVLVEHEITKVTFNRLTNEEITAYIKSNDYQGKAGAYGIQNRGAVLIKKVDGCYFNVVGLPIGRVCRMLKDMGEVLYDHWG